MSDIKIYNAKDVTVSVDGRVIQGFQDNDMVSYTRKEDNITTAVDAQGWPSAAINNNHLGQITINLSGESADHKRMNQLANTTKVFPIVISSPTEKISGSQAMIGKPADGAFGKAVPGRTYTIEVLDMQVEVL